MIMRKILGVAVLLTGLGLALPSEAEPWQTKETKRIKRMESFSGKVVPMGMSFFMQGSHQLLDDEGEVIVLLMAKDETLQLSNFEGKNVKVTGATADTVEPGGKILTVDSIEDL